eukprot:1916531-Rhodomonas_salina.1
MALPGVAGGVGGDHTAGAVLRERVIADGTEIAYSTEIAYGAMRATRRATVKNVKAELAKQVRGGRRGRREEEGGGGRREEGGGRVREKGRGKEGGAGGRREEEGSGRDKGCYLG